MKKYEIIFNQLKSNILAGKYNFGERIPTEMELCKMFGTSRVPIQQALNGLSELGFIKREMGRGTFVTYKSPIMEYGVYKVSFIMNNNEWESLRIIEGAQKVFSEKGIFLTTNFTEFDVEKEAVLLEGILKTDLSGLIIYLNFTDANLSIIYELIAKNFPIVFVDKYPENMICSSVMANPFQATFMQVEHLVNNGHKRIGFVGYNSSHILSVYQRYQGFCYALKHFNLQHDESFMSLNWDIMGNIGTIMERDDRPTAFVCASDSIALLCMEKIKSMGFSVPNDISIIGHDDIKIRLDTEPLLTTVRQPFYEIGENAAQMIIDMLQKKENNCNIKYLPVEFVGGNSVKKIN